MHKRMVITLSSIAALAIIAVVGKSALMFVSATAIGAMAYLLRGARMRDLVIAVIAAALGGSIGAEIVHTLYHHLGTAESVADSGGFFMSAIQVGLINAAVVVIVLITAKAWLK